MYIIIASCPAGQIFASCGSTCRPTCEDQRPRTCIGSCLPGCRCPEGTFLNRRVSKCVDSDDCGNCPPGKDPVICLVNPCTQSTCSNFPEAECLFDNCGGCFARFFIGLREVTRQCRITGNLLLHHHYSCCSQLSLIFVMILLQVHVVQFRVKSFNSVEAVPSHVLSQHFSVIWFVVLGVAVLLDK